MKYDEWVDFNKILREVCIDAIGIDPDEISLEGVYEIFLKMDRSNLTLSAKFFDSYATELILPVRFYPRQVFFDRGRVDVFLKFDVLNRKKDNNYGLAVKLPQANPEQFKVFIYKNSVVDVILTPDQVRATLKNRIAGWLLARM